jgi:hypothetical protein
VGFGSEWVSTEAGSALQWPVVTASIVADGGFYNLVLTSASFPTIVIGDAGLNAQSSVTTAEFSASWTPGAGKGFQIQSYVITDEVIAGHGNLSQVVANLQSLLTALGQLFGKCSDYVAAATSFAQGFGLGDETWIVGVVPAIVLPSPIFPWLGIVWMTIQRFAAETGVMGPVSGPGATLAGYTQISGNWGRMGMVVPNLQTSTSLCKMTAPGAFCSAVQSQAEVVSPSQLPLTWLSGQYAGQWFCPESMDILYPQPGE